MTVALTVAGLVALLLTTVIVARNWLKWRGSRVITCPENHRPAGVRVDAGRAALHGASDLRLKDCSRWPDKRDCGQECLRQIENSPDGCLVRNILAQWYAGKDCVCCGAPLGHIDWHERKPALMDPDGNTVEWHDILPQQVPDVLATHRPVCWNCHIVEGFRRQHPELVVERPR
jgi:hypothetical protein